MSASAHKKRARTPSRGRRSETETQRALSLADEWTEKHGSIASIREIATEAKRRGIFAAHNTEEMVISWHVRQMQRLFKSKDRQGLPRLVHTGEVWIPLRLATKEQAFAGFGQVVKQWKWDARSIHRLWEHLMDRFKDAPQLPPMDEAWLSHLEDAEEEPAGEEDEE